MVKDSQGSSHHLKVVGGAYGKRKDLIYETTFKKAFSFSLLTFPYIIYKEYQLVKKLHCRPNFMTPALLPCVLQRNHKSPA